MIVKYRVENRVRNEDQIIKGQNAGQITGQNDGQITGQDESTTHTHTQGCDFALRFYTGIYNVILHPRL